jgi:hypothetical protein
MSFLDQKYSATVAARLTQKGRNAISNGSFNISYFAIGDSEYNYYTGSLIEKVLTPFDRDNNIKYPLWYTSGTTIYGVPAVGSMTATCSDAVPLSDPASTGWTSNVVWEKNPIGYTGSTPFSFTGFTNASYLGTKSYFGYSSSSGQTYYATTGSTTGSTTGTTITNTVGSTVIITPEEQKAIAILHYTQNGTSQDIYFKYDDYISVSNTNVTSPNTITDQKYFKLTIPSLMYHRSSGTTSGETFYMSSGNTKMMGSNYNSNYTINYKDLVDYTGNTVGKIFYNQQIIVFDDEEIVAALDTGSTRNFTLPAPFVNGLVTNNDYITGLTSGQTIWVTYMLSGGTASNTLPCNYFMKVTGSTNHEAVTVQFGGSSFNFLSSGYTASKLYILYQITTTGTPIHDQWNMMDFGDASLLKTGHTYTIYQSNITGATRYTSTLHDFGNGGKNPGSVQLVRASDIEEMCFNLSLPSTVFNTTQNPTYKSGNPIMTEVSLLDNNKNTLVMGKLATPIQRIGSQVIQVKLDF